MLYIITLEDNREAVVERGQLTAARALALASNKNTASAILYILYGRRYILGHRR
jgi:hypothetical protein